MRFLIAISTLLLVLPVVVLPANAQSEATVYSSFEAALLAGNVDRARQLGENFVENFPDSDQVHKVNYWLGSFETEYKSAWSRLEDVVRHSDGDSETARMARQRMVDFALLEGQLKDAVDVLRDSEKAERSDPERLAEIRVQLAAVYLALDRHRNASSKLRAVSGPDALSQSVREQFRFEEAAFYWQNRQRREFWQKQLVFEDEFPHSHYLPSMLWMAADVRDRMAMDLTADEKDLLWDIAKFYPASPESLMARRVLAR